VSEKIEQSDVMPIVSQSVYSFVGNHPCVRAYGGGVQSVALLHKYVRGEIERPDLVIFADTKQEPASVYETVKRDREICESKGIEFVVVSYGDLGDQDRKGIFIPAYTLNKNGRKGTLMRQCTDRFKIQPIRKEIRRRGLTNVEMWLGISTDEASRQKPSSVKYITNRYPLIEMGMSRTDCEAYLAKIKITASKSACVFCPYRSAKAWASLTKEEMQQAIKYDVRLRDRMKGVKLYVHSSRTPLSDAIGLTGEKNVNLFENECEGYCGI
jgi:hypothetical protein